MKHSVEFRKVAVQKYLSRGNRSVKEIIQELGIPAPTLYQWRNQFANISGMTKQTKPQVRSVSEKLKALMDYDALSVEKRGEFLRANGLHEEHIVEWRNQIEEAFAPKKLASGGRKELAIEKNKVKRLEKEIRRKDKALAEVSALLVLKKKAELIWGTTEEDE